MLARECVAVVSFWENCSRVLLPVESVIVNFCVMCGVKCALVWVFHSFGLLVYESIDEMKYLNKKLIRTCPLGEYCYYVEAI